MLSDGAHNFLREEDYVRASMRDNPAELLHQVVIGRQTKARGEDGLNLSLGDYEVNVRKSPDHATILVFRSNG